MAFNIRQIFAALNAAQVAIPHLIDMKRRAGRPRDLDDIQKLEAIARGAGSEQ